MELSTHVRKIFGVFDRLKGRESQRASDTGEDREELGSMIELTGLSKKAVSFVRMLDKQEPEKRNDILRSLDPLLAVMHDRWAGIETPDMFTNSERVNVEEGRHPIDDGEPDAVMTEDEIAETAGEFDAALDGLEAEDDEPASTNVVPFGEEAAA